MFFNNRNKADASDEELMHQVGQGSESALAALYDRYAMKMVRFFSRMLGNDNESAQDMLHDLFMKIIEKPEKYDRSKSFAPWLYTIAANMCRNRIRNHTNRLKLLSSPSIEDNESGTDIVNEEDMRLFMKEYHRMYDTLEEEHQLLLTLRFQQELMVKEIGQIMGLPEGTVKSRLFYLMKKFSKHLHEFNPHK